MFGIPEREFTRWLSKDADRDYKSGACGIPQMPHYPGTPVTFPIKLLREWREKYFLVGGDREEAA